MQLSRSTLLIPSLLIGFISTSSVGLILTSAAFGQVPAVTSPETDAVKRQHQAEQFFDLLFSQRYEEAAQYITPVHQTEFSPEALQRKVEGFQQAEGAFVKRLNASVSGDIVVIDLQFEQRTVTFIVSFDQNLKIVGANPVLETLGETAPE